MTAQQSLTSSYLAAEHVPDKYLEQCLLSDKCSEAVRLVKFIWLPCQALPPTFTPSDRTYRACARPSSEVLNPIKAALGVLLAFKRGRSNAHRISSPIRRTSGGDPPVASLRCSQLGITEIVSGARSGERIPASYTALLMATHGFVIAAVTLSGH